MSKVKILQKQSCFAGQVVITNCSACFFALCCIIYWCRISCTSSVAFPASVTTLGLAVCEQASGVTKLECVDVLLPPCASFSVTARERFSELTRFRQSGSINVTYCTHTWNTPAKVAARRLRGRSAENRVQQVNDSAADNLCHLCVASSEVLVLMICRRKNSQKYGESGGQIATRVSW